VRKALKDLGATPRRPGRQAEKLWTLEEDE